MAGKPERDFKKSEAFYLPPLPSTPETRCYHLTAVSTEWTGQYTGKGHCPNIPCDPQQAKYSQRGFSQQEEAVRTQAGQSLPWEREQKGRETSHLSQSGADAEHLTCLSGLYVHQHNTFRHYHPHAEDESAGGQWGRNSTSRVALKSSWFISPQEFKVLETQPITLNPVTVTQYLQGPTALTHSWVLGTVKLTSSGD